MEHSMEHSMGHSVGSAVVASECSPPPMCGLGRSEGFWRIAPLAFVPDLFHGFVPMDLFPWTHDKAQPLVRLGSYIQADTCDVLTLWSGRAVLRRIGRHHLRGSGALRLQTTNSSWAR